MCAILAAKLVWGFQHERGDPWCVFLDWPTQTPPHRSVDERIAAALARVDRPLPFAELRALCRVRTATLYERLAALTEQGSLIRSDDGYRLGAS